MARRKRKPGKWLVMPGDSWAKIAGRFYGDQRRFYEIMAANPHVRTLQPGDMVRLPWLDLDKMAKIPKAAWTMLRGGDLSYYQIQHGMRQYGKQLTAKGVSRLDVIAEDGLGAADPLGLSGPTPPGEPVRPPGPQPLAPPQEQFYPPQGRVGGGALLTPSEEVPLDWEAQQRLEQQKYLTRAPKFTAPLGRGGGPEQPQTAAPSWQDLYYGESGLEAPSPEQAQKMFEIERMMSWQEVLPRVEIGMLPKGDTPGTQPMYGVGTFGMISPAIGGLPLPMTEESVALWDSFKNIGASFLQYFNFGINAINQISKIPERLVLFPIIAGFDVDRELAGPPSAFAEGMDPRKQASLVVELLSPVIAWWDDMVHREPRPLFVNPETGQLGRWYILASGRWEFFTEDQMQQWGGAPPSEIAFEGMRDIEAGAMMRWDLSRVITNPDGTLNWDNLVGVWDPYETNTFEALINATGVSGISVTLALHPERIPKLIEAVDNNEPLGDIILRLEDPWAEAVFNIATDPLMFLEILGLPVIIGNSIFPFAPVIGKGLSWALTKSRYAARAAITRAMQEGGNLFQRWFVNVSKRSAVNAFSNASGDALSTVALRHADDMLGADDAVEMFQRVILDPDSFLGPETIGSGHMDQLRDIKAILSENDLIGMEDLLKKYGAFEAIPGLDDKTIRILVGAGEPDTVAQYIRQAVTSLYAKELGVRNPSKASFARFLRWIQSAAKENWLAVNVRYMMNNMMDNQVKTVISGYTPAFRLGSYERISKYLREDYLTVLPSNTVQALVADALDLESGKLATELLPWPIGSDRGIIETYQVLTGQRINPKIRKFLGGNSIFAKVIRNVNYSKVMKTGFNISAATERAARANIFIQAFEADLASKGRPQLLDWLRSQPDAPPGLARWVTSDKIKSPLDFDRFIKDVIGESLYDEVADNHITDLIPNSFPRNEFRDELVAKFNTIQARYFGDWDNPNFSASVFGAIDDARLAMIKSWKEVIDATIDEAMTSVEQLAESTNNPLLGTRPEVMDFAPRGIKDLLIESEGLVAGGIPTLPDPQLIQGTIDRALAGIPPDNVVLASLFQYVDESGAVQEVMDADSIRAIAQELSQLTPEEIHARALQNYNDFWRPPSYLDEGLIPAARIPKTAATTQWDNARDGGLTSNREQIAQALAPDDEGAYLYDRVVYDPETRRLASGGAHEEAILVLDLETEVEIRIEHDFALDPRSRELHWHTSAGSEFFPSTMAQDLIDAGVPDDYAVLAAELELGTLGELVTPTARLPRGKLTGEAVEAGPKVIGPVEYWEGHSVYEGQAWDDLMKEPVINEDTGRFVNGFVDVKGRVYSGMERHEGVSEVVMDSLGLPKDQEALKEFNANIVSYFTVTEDLKEAWLYSPTGRDMDADQAIQKLKELGVPDDYQVLNASLPDSKSLGTLGELTKAAHPETLAEWAGIAPEIGPRFLPEEDLIARNKTELGKAISYKGRAMAYDIRTGKFGVSEMHNEAIQIAIGTDYRVIDGELDIYEGSDYLRFTWADASYLSEDMIPPRVRGTIGDDVILHHSDIMDVPPLKFAQDLINTGVDPGTHVLYQPYVGLGNTEYIGTLEEILAGEAIRPKLPRVVEAYEGLTRRSFNQEFIYDMIYDEANMSFALDPETFQIVVSDLDSPHSAAMLNKYKAAENWVYVRKVNGAYNIELPREGPITTSYATKEAEAAITKLLDGIGETPSTKVTINGVEQTLSDLKGVPEVARDLPPTAPQKVTLAISGTEYDNVNDFLFGRPKVTVRQMIDAVAQDFTVPEFTDQNMIGRELIDDEIVRQVRVRAKEIGIEQGANKLEGHDKYVVEVYAEIDAWKEYLESQSNDVVRDYYEQSLGVIEAPEAEYARSTGIFDTSTGQWHFEVGYDHHGLAELLDVDREGIVQLSIVPGDDTVHLWADPKDFEASLQELLDLGVDPNAKVVIGGINDEAIPLSSAIEEVRDVLYGPTAPAPVSPQLRQVEFYQYEMGDYKLTAGTFEDFEYLDEAYGVTFVYDPDGKSAFGSRIEHGELREMAGMESAGVDIRLSPNENEIHVFSGSIDDDDLIRGAVRSFVDQLGLDPEDWNIIGFLDVSRKPAAEFLAEGIDPTRVPSATQADLIFPPSAPKVAKGIFNFSENVPPMWKRVFKLRVNGLSSGKYPMLGIFTPNQDLIWSVKYPMHGPLLKGAGYGIGEVGTWMMDANGGVVASALGHEQATAWVNAMIDRGADLDTPARIVNVLAGDEAWPYTEKQWIGTLGEFVGKSEPKMTGVEQAVWDDGKVHWRDSIVEHANEELSLMLDGMDRWKNSIVGLLGEGGEGGGGGIGINHLSSAERDGFTAVAKEAQKKWTQSIEDAAYRAVAEVNRILFDYASISKAEEVLRFYSPFTTWQLRNPVFWAQAFLNNPSLLGKAISFWRASELDRRKKNLTSRFEGTVGMEVGEGGPIPAGYYGVKPENLISMFGQYQEPFEPPGAAPPETQLQSFLQKVIQTGQKFGIHPWPWISYPLEKLGLVPKGSTNFSFGPQQRAIEMAMRQIGQLGPTEQLFGENAISQWLNEYYVNRRLTEMEAEGLIDHMTFLEAVRNPEHEAFQMAQAQVLDIQTMLGTVGLVNPFTLKYASPGELKIREELAQRKEMSPLDRYWFNINHPYLESYSNVMSGDEVERQLSMIFETYNQNLQGLFPWEDEYKELVGRRSAEIEDLLGPGESIDELQAEYLRQPVVLGQENEYGTIYDEDTARISVLYRLRNTEPKAGDFKGPSGDIDWDAWDSAMDAYHANIDELSDDYGFEVTLADYIAFRYRGAAPTKVAYDMYRDWRDKAWETYEELEPGGEGFQDALMWAAEQQRMKDLAAGFTMSEASELLAKNLLKWQLDGLPYEYRQILLEPYTADQNLTKFAEATAELMGIDLTDTAQRTNLIFQIDHDLPGMFGDQDVFDFTRTQINDYYYNLRPNEQNRVRSALEMDYFQIPEDPVEMMELFQKLQFQMMPYSLREYLIVADYPYSMPELPPWDDLSDEEVQELEQARVDMYRYNKAREAGVYGSWTDLLTKYYSNESTAQSKFWAETTRYSLNSTAFDDPIIGAILSRTARQALDFTEDQYAAALTHFKSRLDEIVDWERTALMYQYPNWYELAQQQRREFDQYRVSEMEALKGIYYSVPYKERDAWASDNLELWQGLEDYLMNERARALNYPYYAFFFKTTDYGKYYGSLTPDQITPRLVPLISEDYLQSLRDMYQYIHGLGDWTEMMTKFLGPPPGD